MWMTCWGFTWVGSENYERWVIWKVGFRGLVSVPWQHIWLVSVPWQHIWLVSVPWQHIWLVSVPWQHIWLVSVPWQHIWLVSVPWQHIWLVSVPWQHICSLCFVSTWISGQERKLLLFHTLCTDQICNMVLTCPEFKMTLQEKKFNHINKIQTKCWDTISEFETMHIMKWFTYDYWHYCIKFHKAQLEGDRIEYKVSVIVMEK
jgi:hypothetical protein